MVFQDHHPDNRILVCRAVYHPLNLAQPALPEMAEDCPDGYLPDSRVLHDNGHDRIHPAPQGPATRFGAIFTVLTV